MEKYRGSRSAVARFALAAALGLVVAAPGLFALDLSGRTDTGYRLDYADSATVNRAWNTHSLDLGILPGLDFSMYGGLEGTFGTASTSGTVLMSLPDAQNGDSVNWVDYDLYTASLTYSMPTFGLSFGRLDNQPGAMASFDGLSAWVAPLSWLRVDLFGGVPWSDASLVRFATNEGNLVSAGNLEGGATLSATLPGSNLSLSGGYAYLAQTTPVDGTIAASSSLITDQVVRASATWSPLSYVSAGVNGTLVDYAPVDASLWLGGVLDAAHLSYNANGDVQFVGASSFGASLSNFAAILGAANSYLSASVDLSEDLGAFFLPQGGPVTYFDLDAGYDHRQTLSSTQVENDPSYEQFRVGPALGFAFGLGLYGYYNYLSPTGGFEESINAFGGEISEKVAAFEFRLGTSFSANTWEEDANTIEYNDSFAAQEYYVSAKYKASKALDLNFKGSYETAQQTLNVSASDGSQSDAGQPYAVHVELSAGYKY